jgi:hypothetical protein
MWRVNKLSKEQHFNEQQALSVISDELHIDSEDDSRLSQYGKQTISPKVNKINVEQTQTKFGITMILHKVEFSSEYIAAFLTIENTSDDQHTIIFQDSKSIATQGDYELKVSSRGPNYRSFRRSIRYDTNESGVVKFEALHDNETAIKFEFVCRNVFETFGEPNWQSFEFEVQIR